MLTPPRRLRPSIPLLPAALPLALALACGAVQAQSLQELYDAARGYDASYLAVRAQAEASGYAAAEADALNRPSAALAGSATRTQAHVQDLGQFGNTTTQVQIQGKQPLFNRANGTSIAQAYKSLDAAQTDLALAEQDLIVRVSQAYFDVLGAQDTLGYTRTSKAAIAEQLASAKRNFEVGTATITDTREAQARFDLATAQEISAENDLRTKRATLDQLVGRADVEPRPLAKPVSLPPLTGNELDAWLNQADSNHPSVRKARLGLDIARLETDKARAGNLPTVDLVGSLSSSHSSGDALFTVPGTTNSASIGVQFNLPLFAGYSIQNRIKETLVLEDKSRNDLEQARRSVALGTRTAYLSLQSGSAQVKALEAAESSSQLALESTQLGYKVGVRVNLDVLNAQTQLFQTQRDLAKARYDVLVGSLKLRQAAGQLTTADLQPINGLIAP